LIDVDTHDTLICEHAPHWNSLREQVRVIAAGFVGRRGLDAPERDRHCLVRVRWCHANPGRSIAIEADTLLGAHGRSEQSRRHQQPCTDGTPDVAVTHARGPILNDHRVEREASLPA
jgi:hypothetical protein